MSKAQVGGPESLVVGGRAARGCAMTGRSEKRVPFRSAKNLKLGKVPIMLLYRELKR